MLKKLLLVLALCPFILRAQDVITVQTDQFAKDDKYDKSKNLVPLFIYKGPVIEEYEKFGVPNKKPLQTFTLKKLPDMTGAMDTAYGFIYFSGQEPRQVNNGYVTVLVINYRRTPYKPAILFVDRNNNYDFTDDGPSDTVTFTEYYQDITLTNQYNPAGKYTVRLSRFPFSTDLNYKMMLDEYYQRYQGKKVFSGSDYSFRENRLNMRGGLNTDNGDTFKIALYDGNYDGLYNNGQFDRVYLSSVSDTVFTDRHVFSFRTDLKDAEFEWNFKVYRITEIDPAGHYIKFYWDKNAYTKRSLRVGKKIPKFKYHDNDGVTLKKVKKLRHKPLYIYFYNTQNTTFDADTTALRTISNNYCHKINLLCLNYGDYSKNVEALVKYSGIPWAMGLSNGKINRQFNIETLPIGFLCKKRLRLYKKNITPQEVLAGLERGDLFK